MAPRAKDLNRVEMESDERNFPSIPLNNNNNDDGGHNHDDGASGIGNPNEDIEPLLGNSSSFNIESNDGKTAGRGVHSPVRRRRPGDGSDSEEEEPFWNSAYTFALCFCGLMASYLTWGYMQELIMTSQFNPTERVPDGKFPSAAFCVFSNRLLAVIVAMIMVRIRHGSVFSKNVAPLYAFCPPALSNTVSSWSQYAALKYVTFPEQTVFKSSKIIAVMLMGKALQGKTYPWVQYLEAFLITIGVMIFSLASKEGAEDRDNHTEIVGFFFLVLYITFDSFTSQYQDKIYRDYGRPNVDAYQMMLGVNISAICMTTAGLLISGDIPVVWEFLLANPNAAWYNLLTAITSASGQIAIFSTIKYFGPIVLTIIMTTRQMLSICISAVVFGHVLSAKAIGGAILVFCVLFDRIRRKFASRNGSNAGSGRSPKKDDAPSRKASDPSIEPLSPMTRHRTASV